MSDDSETAEDTKKFSVAEVTDDSCRVEFIEIVPLDRASDDYNTQGFIPPIFKIRPEDLMDVKQETANENGNEDANYPVIQELADDYETEHPCFTIQVSSLVFS